ncbi:MAG TPA: hypothetical protein PLQ57_09760 [Saprospiraceae bacterium]|nr:hypothetical protein [Saprospiraceae bacterium]HRG65335.1 hypothetical protein [Saprospiraceae bacterium]
MRVEELTKRDLKKNPLMVKDKSLDRFKKVQIPQHKVDSANEISKMEDFKELVKEKIAKL